MGFQVTFESENVFAQSLLVGQLGSGPHLVGRIWSGVRVSASF